MDGLVEVQSPTKRQKLSPNPDIDRAMRIDGITSQIGGFAQPTIAPSGFGNFTDLRFKEMEVGITAYIDSTTLGFSGIVKKRYTDFLVNEILPTGQVLHLESIEVRPRPNQTGQSGKGIVTATQQSSEVPARVGHMSRTDIGITVSGQQPSSEVTASSGPSEELQKKREDAIAAWGRLPAQLALEDAEHRKKQLAEYAAYKVREGLSDPQSDIPKYENKDTLMSNTDTQVIGSSLQRDIPECESKGIVTPNSDKGAATPSDLRKEAPGHESEEILVPVPDKLVVDPSNVGMGAADEKSFQLSAEDESLLLTFFTSPVLGKILTLYNAALEVKDNRNLPFDKVKSDIPMGRTQRTRLHQSMRRIFRSRLETETGEDGAVAVSFSNGSGRSRWGTMSHQTQRPTFPQPNRKSVREERRGEYLHFTLYKENKDTMEVISFLAKQLRIQPRSLQFAGTKDRRAVTVQRISAHRLDARKLAGMNKFLRGSRVGGFEYKNEGLSLGDLAGNEFVITLRDCKFPDTKGMRFQEKLTTAKIKVMDSALNLEQKGFLNYYGLQRFGTFATGTHEVGMQMLQGNFQRACEQILSFSEEALAAANDPQTLLPDGPMVSSDDIRRAIALDLFKKTGQGKEALDRLPRKFSAESALIKHLSQSGKAKDWQGALQQISRPLRLMYVHAYQSLVWNIVAGERWKRWGDKVVEGDLVLVRDHGGVEADTDSLEEEDEVGEVVIHAHAQSGRGRGGEEFERARPVSGEEAASGNISIFDIVLPTPGFDIVYPRNSLADFYKEFMESERGGKLDPHDMRRSWKDISLSGSYRKLIGVVRGLGLEVKPYVGEDEQMVATDLERLQKTKRGETGGDKNFATVGAKADGSEDDENQKIAVIVKFQLGTSQYATMALREFMKDGGAVTYKPEYGDGR
ncbi:hypothetical protein FGG08_002435 [Glutinoglossum americanum]|uniref:TRUD domain-containing protein n=1 Tax=Glutinoglossum americanum TaxID=1670608 RepID=A0A9P8I4X2_9PEZI|nr:hypothetical protein FGG08_002435 [Glutinoglossum americanum]